VRKIIVKKTAEPAASAFGHRYFAYLEGKEDASRYGYGETPQTAKRELLLSQEVMETSSGASISVWTSRGHVKLWACTNDGTSTSVALQSWEVEAFIEQLQLGREAV
jgi:hypothetical protein